MILAPRAQTRSRFDSKGVRLLFPHNDSQTAGEIADRVATVPEPC